MKRNNSSSCQKIVSSAGSALISKKGSTRSAERQVVNLGEITREGRLECSMPYQDEANVHKKDEHQSAAAANLSNITTTFQLNRGSFGNVV